MSERTELRAAAARLLYNSNRSTSDYDMLIDFIDSHFDNQPTAYDVEAVVRELEQEKFVAYLKGDIAAMEHNMALNKAIAIVKRGGRNE